LAPEVTVIGAAIEKLALDPKLLQLMAGVPKQAEASKLVPEGVPKYNCTELGVVSDWVTLPLASIIIGTLTPAGPLTPNQYSS
jgi:hypothetical protein